MTHPGEPQADALASTRLRDYLREQQVDATLTRPGVDMPTVPLAAAALGVEPGQVVKSIVFESKKGRQQVGLAIAPGDLLIDAAKVAAALGFSALKLAHPNTVLRVSGYAVGGVPPVGHSTALPVVVDKRVLGYTTVYGGGGDEQHMLQIRPEDIVRLTGAVVADIAAAPAAAGKQAAATGAQVIGRLSKAPHPELFKLLYEPRFREDEQHVLPHLLRVDMAHVVMLSRRGILAREVAARLLSLNLEMAEQVRKGGSLLSPPASHRGLYLLYESQYVERLGPEVGGAAHIARSRNDINAAVTRMRLRAELLDLLGEWTELSRAMATLAEAHLETAMPAFTHLQPAQPSSLGHYLAAVLSELLRTAHWVADAYPRLNLSPMGAAAGVGTSFPIDRDEVAQMLGFTGVIANSIDAVASRDYVVHVLSGLSLLGVTLTRLATDLQAWASHAYHFVSWPDDMVSTSSIMPQKRNAFVLENIRGQAVQATGSLMSAILGMKNTPFANSVEVSAESTAPLWPALHSTRLALRLCTLLLKNIIVQPARMGEFLRAADTTMTALADLLVAQHGLPFRSAHDVVGKLVTRRLDAPAQTLAELGRELEVIIAEKTGRAVTLAEADLARALDPDAGLRAALYGGGPAPGSVRAQLRLLDAQRELLAGQTEERRQHLVKAAADLTQAATAIAAEAR